MTVKLIGEGNSPLICTPLVEKSSDLILEELNYILTKQPDIVEWRADLFAEIDNTNEVISLLKQLKLIAGNIPMIFTVRSHREGGNLTPLTSEEILELLCAVCKNTDIDYIDYELSNAPEHIGQLRKITAEHGTKIIASFHNFNHTPDRETLLSKFAEAKHANADVAKIAVMPNNMEDVLTLLGVTLEAKNTIGIPVIALSMGNYGVVTRVIGGAFGSAVTFAVGRSSSAPGQIPIEELRIVLDLLRKSS